jgi:hypothetical protein
MNEIVRMVVEKVGISEEQATKAVETVASYLKQHLPEPVALQIENVLGGGDGTEQTGIGATIGGMFGKH